MSFLRRHGKLMGFAGLMLLGIWGLSKGVVEENILALIPRTIKQQVSLFEHSPLSQKLIVITQSPSATQAQQLAQKMENALAESGFITPRLPTDTYNLPGILSALPELFSPKLEQETKQKISPQAVARQLARYYEELFSFQSVMAAEQIKQDPFNLAELVFKRWADIGKGVQTLQYAEGFLSDDTGTLLAGLYDTQAAVSDITTARQLQKFFEEFRNSWAGDARVFFMGGLRYTLENVLLIKRDLTVVTGAGLACLLGVFIGFFRTRRALWVYMLPLLVLPPAAWVTQGVFGHISGITLGFGSVVVGLSVDYAIYIYFALQQTEMDTKVAVSKIMPHLWCNFLTSGLCFIALSFSSIEVFKQIAVFALVALALAFLISVWVFPGYFKTSEKSRVKKMTTHITPLPFNWAVTAGLVLIVFGAWGVTHLALNSDLSALNSTSAVFARDKQTAEKLFPSNSGALLFALGKTPDEALDNNEQLSARLPERLPVSDLFVSDKTRQQNLNRWTNFWNLARQKNLQKELRQAGQKQGFTARSFDPFWTWLQTAAASSKIDFSNWYNPLVQLGDSSYAVVNVVPNQSVYAQFSDGIKAVFVSVSGLQAELTQRVKNEALYVVSLALLFNLIAVWLLFRNIKETLLCFVPVVLGGGFLFGCLALLRLQVNLFGLIFLPLLVGLGLDYAIFQLMKFRSSGQEPSPIYPTRALVAAGLSTLAGFGVLVLAKHAVLFMMGVCALIGIGGTVLVSLFILPALWERYVCKNS